MGGSGSLSRRTRIDGKTLIPLNTNLPIHEPAADPTGLRLLQDRVDRIPQLLEAYGVGWRSGVGKDAKIRRVAATGIGSSEAHARYLVGLLNRHTEIPAEFVPLGRFADTEIYNGGDRTLVLFSQGLSANARIALDRRHRFAHRVLFTSSTPEGLRAGGKADRADVLDRLLNDGGEVVGFPPEDEYTILIRVLGPVLGFLAARLWVGEHSGGRFVLNAAAAGRSAAQAYLNGAASGAELAARFGGDPFRNGAVVPASSGILDWSQNLSCKFVEGLYRPAPAMMDLLQFAHGPFQQLNREPRPVWVVHRETPDELDLLGRISEMCRNASLPLLHAPRGLVSTPDWMPIEAEGLFNAALFPGLAGLGIDQFRWPGKGLDGPLYHYSGPEKGVAEEA